MSATVDFWSKVGVLGVIDPDAHTAGTYTTGWVEAGLYGSLGALVMAGTLGTAATLAGKIEKSYGADDTARNANAADLAGAAITALVKADNDGDHAGISIKPVDLGETAGGIEYTHVRLSITVGTATSDAGAVLLGLEPRFGPAKSVATLVETV